MGSQHRGHSKTISAYGRWGRVWLTCSHLMGQPGSKCGLERSFGVGIKKDGFLLPRFFAVPPQPRPVTICKRQIDGVEAFSNS